MMRDMKTLVILALGAAALLGADFVAEGDRWWAHIQFLADDKLQGRDTGSEGYSEAAKYVAGKMEAFGLKPAGTSGHLQAVKAHVGSASERWAVLKAAGAIGTAAIMNPRGPGGGLGQGGGRGPQKAFLLADPELQESAGQKVAITITRQGGDKFLAGSGHTMDEILKLAGENQPLPKFPLVGTLRTKAAVKRETLEAPNVVGMLPGSDAKLQDEYVIMSAHLDHMGVGHAIDGDTIYNGAMDDASGIASILEMARIMKESGAKPKRSIDRKSTR